jgi:hypothetical protein
MSTPPPAKKSILRRDITAGRSGPSAPRKPTVPGLPIVNLLPPRLELQKVRRSTRRGFTIAVILVVTSALGVWGLQFSLIAEAQNELRAAETRLQEAADDASIYTPVENYYASLDLRSAFVEDFSGAKLDYSEISGALTEAMNGRASLTGLTINRLSITAGQDALTTAGKCGPVTDPFSLTDAVPYACVTFTGTTPVRSELGEISSALKAQGWFTNVSIIQGATPDGVVEFVATAVLTDQALIGAAEKTETDQ